MMIETLKLGPYQTNCYILYEEGQAIVIDPGASDEVLDFLNRNKLKLLYILNTHSHGDHTGGNYALKNNIGAQILIHEKDNLVEADGFLKDKDVINIPLNNDEMTFKVIHTPGHTPGSIAFLSKFGLFSGDTIFKRAIGRFDLPFASAKELKTSLEKILSIVPLDTIIYPGHGPSTILRDEEVFLRRIIKELSSYET